MKESSLTQIPGSVPGGLGLDGNTGVNVKATTPSSPGVILPGGHIQVHGSNYILDLYTLANKFVIRPEGVDSTQNRVELPFDLGQENSQIMDGLKVNVYDQVLEIGVGDATYLYYIEDGKKYLTIWDNKENKQRTYDVSGKEFKEDSQKSKQPKFSVKVEYTRQDGSASDGGASNFGLGPLSGSSLSPASGNESNVIITVEPPKKNWSIKYNTCNGGNDGYAGDCDNFTASVNIFID